MAHSNDTGRLSRTTTLSTTTISSVVEQIERALAQLCESAALEPPIKANVTTHEQARMLIESRRIRFEIFPPMLFSDPAWDMLLELYVRQLERLPMNISRLTAAVPVPETTVLRWIAKLEHEALITRRRDIHDAKRVWIELSQYGRSLMDRYFEACRRCGSL